MLLIVSAWLGTSSAQAADAAAEALFQDAVRLMKRGSFAEACTKLEASQRREPRAGTLLNLAACEEKLGKTATAWALYKDAASLSRSEGRTSYAEKAVRFAQEIEPRLVRVRISMEARSAGEVVLLDGAQLEPGSLGTPLPVDPGPHVVEARADGFAPYRAELDVVQSVDLSIPALSPVPVVLADVAPPAPAQAAQLPEPVRDARSGPHVPIWVWASGGVGLASIATSVYFRVDQRDASRELDDACGGDRQSCPADYDFGGVRDREQRDFRLFVGLGVVGLAAAGAATYGLVRALRSPARADQARITPQLGVGVGTLAAGVRGTF